MTIDRSDERASTPMRPIRPRDAAASRQRLLAAARVLFGQNGFEATTIRDIGERAGVDAALIARYFGSKADLYIATVISESQYDKLPSAFNEVAEALITRADEHGVGAVTQALVRSETAPEIRSAAQAHMARRLVAPMAADLTRQGYDRPELRSAIIAAALIGVNLGRALGWVDALASVPKDELVELVTAMLDGNTAQ
jgi:AcrR family transcriptional regulator